MNKRITAVLCTATALGAVLAVPTAAQADESRPKGFSARVEHETVTLDFSGDPPKDLKVHLRKKGTTKRVATVTSFHPVRPEDWDPCADSCGDPDPTWFPVRTAPLKLADLGEYAVDVEYDGTGGETVLHKDKAVLTYQVRPSFTNLKATNGVSFARPDTVVSGDIKLYDPRNGSLKPYAGGAFTTRTGTVSSPLTADAKGHFTSKVTFSGAESGTTRAGHDSTYVHLASKANGSEERASVAVPVTASTAARIALDSPTVTGPYGTAGKVSGTVTWKSADGSWKPAPAGLRIAVDTGAGLPHHLTTGSAGRLEGSVPLTKDTTWRIGADSPWASSDTREVTVDTTGGTAFIDFGTTLLQSKYLEVKGTFLSVEVPAGITSLEVDFQYSADGRTGWTTVRKQTVTANSADAFEERVRYPGPGFMRLRYVGTPDIRGSVTPAVRLAERTTTAIPEFNAAPEPVKKGRPITLTGKLTEKSPDWKPFAGQTVRYYFRPAGTIAWKPMGLSKTAADGTFTRKFTADATGSWLAKFVEPTTAHFSASSRVDEVVVTP
ncbi:hypothetical protein ACFYYB_32450 [Streptomyces sp. NPDC002886]|uniref:hypothetical protein n=1 Tax=Streptomyces sp. NPDC002886 TaxID=3364667 RepID=UPI00367CC4DD